MSGARTPTSAPLFCLFDYSNTCSIENTFGWTPVRIPNCVYNSAELYIHLHTTPSCIYLFGVVCTSQSSCMNIFRQLGSGWSCLELYIQLLRIVYRGRALAPEKLYHRAPQFVKINFWKKCTNFHSPICAFFFLKNYWQQGTGMIIYNQTEGIRGSGYHLSEMASNSSRAP